MHTINNIGNIWKANKMVVGYIYANVNFEFVGEDKTNPRRL